jgi:hypothetical protein
MLKMKLPGRTPRRTVDRRQIWRFRSLVTTFSARSRVRKAARSHRELSPLDGDTHVRYVFLKL